MRKGEDPNVDFQQWAGKKALQSFGSDAHLSDEELDAIVDEGLEHPHVATCAMCRAEVDDLRLHVGRASARPSARGALKPVLRVAAIVVAVIALSAIALFLRREEAPVIASNPPAPVNVAPPAPRVVASLNDNNTRIALRDDGTIDGVDLRTPRDADDARAVLSGRTIAIPTFIAAMPGAVRGDAASTSTLRAMEPFRSAVLESRPRFSWTPVPDARSYRVAVFDADYEEIASSEAITRTSWTPSQSLPSGVDLSWHVVAETDAGEISSSGADRAEAVFRVLTVSEAGEVNVGTEHYRDSHLLRGLLYSRHGLLHDAEREFRALAKQNPDSPVARKLITSVSR